MQRQLERLVDRGAPEIEIHQHRAPPGPRQAHRDLRGQRGLPFAADGAGDEHDSILIDGGVAEQFGRDAIDRLGQTDVPLLILGVGLKIKLFFKT